MRRTYQVQLEINERSLKEVIIDSHYEEKHTKSVNDTIILALIQSLDKRRFEPEYVSPVGYEYYTSDPILHEDKPYRLVWLLHPVADYLGVVNCFRRSHGKNGNR